MVEVEEEELTRAISRAGKPLPDRIYNDPDPHRTGLKLSRGPDPRSYRSGAFVMDMGW